ncbi:MAG: 1-acyl-sn-glycerol-3-phosphate acyltransferase [Candidatus Marinimicrobia bacterium]|nr:1-acyl-sn-glycerol-3-phosphate acyltransferase [Candidatus Neomarinimicrobiota bacterium]MCF7828279.1 1-acyl-sn-glycerol-3-phosphate acyltransferase [Candidatus Neomarinimicrobiota bacterium]MCF7879546.1 1-acyl-sn-glycerol-3-phosphate acyltransferase [Candidatus Neomarinimicrobiota bacterium]
MINYQNLTVFNGSPKGGTTINSFDPYTSIDKYITPPNAGKPISRLLPGASFYSKLLWVVIKSGLRAKYGTYSGTDWVNNSAEVFRYLESSGIQYQLEGLNNISATDDPVVFIGNHMSTLETMVLPCLIQPRKETTFVVKQELLEYPFFKHVLGAREPLEVGREKPREDLRIVLRQGKQKLTDGRSVIIFPQRTRSSHFKPKEFNSLGVKLAERSGVPFIPVALVTDAWGNGKLLKDVGKIQPQKTVHFAFGEPRAVSGNTTESHREVLEFIRNKLNEWGREDCLPSD